MSQLDDTLMEKLRQLVKTLDSDEEKPEWLRDLVGWLLQEMLNIEFNEFLGAEPYERSEERQGYRNGYRQRELFTRVGQVTLRVPRDREGRFRLNSSNATNAVRKLWCWRYRRVTCKGFPPGK